MEFLQDYVAVVVVAICFCVGYMLKNAVPSKKINKYIPLMMGLLGVGLNIWFNAWTLSPVILLGGLASGLASTGAFELYKNFTKKNLKGDK